MQYIRIWIALLQRDIYVYTERIPRYLSFSFFYPLFHGSCFGYLLPSIGMGAAASAGTNTILAGIIVLVLLGLSFAVNADFLFDFERERLIDFQLLFSPPWLLIVHRVLFNSLLIFIGAACYYPITKMMFWSVFDVSQARWLQVYGMLYLGALCCAAFQVFVSCTVKKTSNMRHFWRRVNYPLYMLGGFLAPWNVIMHVSPQLGYAMLLNPFVYITEGLRGTLFVGAQGIASYVCAIMLLLNTLLFTGVSLYFFKRKVDHI